MNDFRIGDQFTLFASDTGPTLFHCPNCDSTNTVPKTERKLACNDCVWEKDVAKGTTVHSYPGTTVFFNPNTGDLEGTSRDLPKGKLLLYHMQNDHPERYLTRWALTHLYEVHDMIHDQEKKKNEPNKHFKAYHYTTSVQNTSNFNNHLIVDHHLDPDHTSVGQFPPPEDQGPYWWHVPPGNQYTPEGALHLTRKQMAFIHTQLHEREQNE